MDPYDLTLNSVDFSKLVDLSHGNRSSTWPSVSYLFAFIFSPFQFLFLYRMTWRILEMLVPWKTTWNHFCRKMEMGICMALWNKLLVITNQRLLKVVFSHLCVRMWALFFLDQLLSQARCFLMLYTFILGFSFGEVGCIRTRNEVTCCHFSSDGKLLASAGHDKKVWSSISWLYEQKFKLHTSFLILYRILQIRVTVTLSFLLPSVYL